MKKFFNAIASRAIIRYMTIAVAGLFATGCTAVDDTLGREFIPAHQNQKLQISTLDSVRTFIARNDTLPSNYTGNMYIGNMQDPVFGKTAARAMTDFFPESTIINNGGFFGYKPVADSVFLGLYVPNIYGNPENPVTFNVFAIQDSLKRDSIYNFTVPLADHADLAKPLFSFVMDIKERRNWVVVDLKPTTDGMEFLQKIVDTDSATFANAYTDFHKRFYGLYIAPADDTPDNAAMYEINVRIHPELSIMSSMVIYAHNYEKDDPTLVKDTLASYFYFADRYSSMQFPNMHVSNVTHTYPAEIENNIIDPKTADLKTMTPLSTTYVQSLGGVATYLDFSGMVEKLEALAPEGRGLVINQARIFFPIDEPTTENLDAAPKRMGMFYTYGQPYLSPLQDYGPIPIRDYLYQSEIDPYNPAKLSYDGYIYRSTGWYRMDITYYITSLLSDPENTPKQIWLGPDALTRNSTYSHVALQGSERTEKPIKLVVTYTLLQ